MAKGNTKGYVPGVKGGKSGSVREQSTTGYVPGVKGGKKGTARPAGTPAPTTDVVYPSGSPQNSPGVQSYSPSSKKAARTARKRAHDRRQRKRAVALLKTPKPQRAAYRVKAPKSYEAPKLPKRPTPVPSPKSKPVSFQGKKTAGTPTLKSLQVGSKSGTLKVNKKGYLTTPKVRKVAKEVKRAKAAVRKSAPSTKGLQPAERAVVPLVRKAHRKYPDIPQSVLMAQIKQESGFQPVNESSAGAEGLSQFIPSTAATYGVKYGAGRKEQQSQVTGQAHYLHDLGFAKDPKAAMSGYTGGYSDAEYNDPVLTDAKASYSALDKPGNPKATKRLARAKKQAKKLGLESGKKWGGGGYPAKKAKKLDGAWAGSRSVAMSVVKGLPWGSGKRTPAENAAVGGAPDSDHLTTNKTTFAADLGAGSEVAETVAKRLKLSGWAPGTYERFTSPKFPGYSFQLLWEVEGHYDHVHLGVEWTGEDLPAGTYEGGAGLGLGGGGGGGGMALTSGAISSYAAATGQSAAAVKKKLKAKNGLTTAQIFKKLKQLGVGDGSTDTQTERGSAPSTTLAELEKKYGVA